METKGFSSICQIRTTKVDPRAVGVKRRSRLCSVFHFLVSTLTDKIPPFNVLKIKRDIHHQDLNIADHDFVKYE